MRFTDVKGRDIELRAVCKNEGLVIRLYINEVHEDSYPVNSFDTDCIKKAEECLIRRNGIIRIGNTDDLMRLFKSLLEVEDKNLDSGVVDYLKTLNKSEVKTLYGKIGLLSLIIDDYLK